MSRLNPPQATWASSVLSRPRPRILQEMDDNPRGSYGYDDEHAYDATNQNQPGSQSSPQNFHLPPTLVAHFPALPAPAHPTDLLTPFATGSTSDLFRAIIKRPNPISLEINGELHSNAADVAIQFAAELRVYRKVGKHSGFVAYLGCVEGLGVVLEWVEGPTLLDVLRGPAPPNRWIKSTLAPHKNPSKRRRITWYNQLVDALVHLHSLGLNHGDLSLLNVHVETRSDSIKLIDFGRSISVVGYPCQSLYLPEPDPPTPTVRTDKKLAPPSAMFRPGGAWVDDESRQGRTAGRGKHPDNRSSSQGRDRGRPKLFDRSSGSSTRPGIPLGSIDDGGMLNHAEPPPSRPITHASRLLNQHSASAHGGGGGLGTHSPITMNRSHRASRDMTPVSRPSSTSPVQTRFHLSSSPMSPRGQYDEGLADGHQDGYEHDEWMQVDAYSAPSPSGREYGYPHYPSRQDSREYGQAASTSYGYDRRDSDYYSQSPVHSHPSSRRASRSPSRYHTAAEYANSPRNYQSHHLHPPSRRSTSRSRHMSRSPPPPLHRSQRPTPQQYGQGDPYSHGRGPPPRPPQPRKPPPKPEPIHPGSRPFCAPEILRAPSGSSIDSKTKQWIDPILADAYSLGIIMVCMDLCKLVDINNEKQKREDGTFPDLSETTIFTQLIIGLVRPAPTRERISLDMKMEIPPSGEDDD